MRVYYNEFDKKKCAMLSQLMKDGHITKGDIDDRSIHDVQPGDVAGYDRAHFFAGIGLWDYSLQLAVSVRPISEIDCVLWHTPDCSDRKSAKAAAKSPLRSWTFSVMIR